MIDDPANENNAWHTTVTELMLLFRDALVAMVPILDRTHVKWRLYESYDQWDAIANTLFEQIVVDALHFALVETPHDGVHEPSMRFRKYTMSGVGDDYIVVRSLDNPDADDLIFASFAADDPGFSEVSCYDPAPGVDAIRLPSDRVEFALIRKVPDGTTQRITELVVDDD